LPDKDFEEQWECAKKFISKNNNNNWEASDNDDGNNGDVGGSSNNKKSAKQAILFITDKLLANYSFKTLKYTEEVYYYDSTRGIYIPGGEGLIKSEAEKEMPDISTNQVNEILNHIIRRTLTDRSEFDTDIKWIACKDCMINLKTLEIDKHDPKYMATIQIPVSYNQKGSESIMEYFYQWVSDPISCPCPAIMKFMCEVVAPEDVETILDFIAYCLWRAFPFHKYILFNGGGRNGKGTMLRLIIINFPKQFIEGANADPYLFEKNKY
jgi:phage/plasmid-associated DNA primase